MLVFLKPILYIQLATCVLHFFIFYMCSFSFQYFCYTLCGGTIALILFFSFISYDYYFLKYLTSMISDTIVKFNFLMRCEEITLSVHICHMQNRTDIRKSTTYSPCFCTLYQLQFTDFNWYM